VTKCYRRAEWRLWRQGCDAFAKSFLVCFGLICPEKMRKRQAPPLSYAAAAGATSMQSEAERQSLMSFIGMPQDSAMHGLDGSDWQRIRTIMEPVKHQAVTRVLPVKISMVPQEWSDICLGAVNFLDVLTPRKWGTRAFPDKLLRRYLDDIHRRIHPDFCARLCVPTRVLIHEHIKSRRLVFSCEGAWAAVQVQMESAANDPVFFCLNFLLYGAGLKFDLDILSFAGPKEMFGQRIMDCPRGCTVGQRPASMGIIGRGESNGEVDCGAFAAICAGRTTEVVGSEGRANFVKSGGGFERGNQADKDQKAEVIFSISTDWSPKDDFSELSSSARLGVEISNHLFCIHLLLYCRYSVIGFEDEHHRSTGCFQGSICRFVPLIGFGICGFLWISGWHIQSHCCECSPWRQLSGYAAIRCCLMLLFDDFMIFNDYVGGFLCKSFCIRLL